MSNQYKLVKSLVDKTRKASSNLHYGSTTVRQNSVAIIWRINPDVVRGSPQIWLDKTNQPSTFFENEHLFNNYINNGFDVNANLFDILFIKRANNPRDRHSGQIALPGGRCEENESDFEAAVRETMEEITVDLTQPNFAYMGKLPRNFFVYNRESFQVWLTANVFFCFDSKDVKPIINQSELSDCFWVPFKHFLDAKKGDFRKHVHTHLPIDVLNALSQPLRERAYSIFEPGFDHSTMPILPLPNGEPLWGITLCIISNMFLQMSVGDAKNTEFYNMYHDKLKEVLFYYQKGTDEMDYKARLLKQIFYKLRVKQFSQV